MITLDDLKDLPIMIEEIDGLNCMTVMATYKDGYIMSEPRPAHIFYIMQDSPGSVFKFSQFEHKYKIHIPAKAETKSINPYANTGNYKGD